ncbi:putative aldehyde dehydrogenase family protein [Botrytis fragariae]|uniref:Putative aldehyde dehydrogenase family protein n=1 Tax=Botrytis fragariae TaxID=1964551 RepID=A0A8H6ALK0_9HELO|nr:putative aldehyde dehydrogenase family protein [Botrytis fragariae]KAF5869948.1 putative aldehyde dehydrogenase family protein [Botrytis fragariae]
MSAIGFAIAKQLESGAVHINTVSVRDEPALPMGGMKKSGWGRFNTILSIEKFLVAKTVTWMIES